MRITLSIGLAIGKPHRFEAPIRWQNRVTNKADADRIMRRWAKILNDHLAHVKSTSAS